MLVQPWSSSRCVEVCVRLLLLVAGHFPGQEVLNDVVDVPQHCCSAVHVSYVLADLVRACEMLCASAHIARTLLGILFIVKGFCKAGICFILVSGRERFAADVLPAVACCD